MTCSRECECFRCTGLKICWEVTLIGHTYTMVYFPSSSTISWHDSHPKTNTNLWKQNRHNMNGGQRQIQPYLR